jgi:hypothetical protein
MVYFRALKYKLRNYNWYKTVNPREPYIYLMALICRLYEEKDSFKFSEAWIPLAYIVAISRVASTGDKLSPSN